MVKFIVKKKLYLYPFCLVAGIISALPAIVGRLFILTWIAPAVMYIASAKLREGELGGRYAPAFFFSLGFYAAGYSFVFSPELATGLGAFFIIGAAWLALSLLQGTITALHLPVAYFLSKGGKRRWAFALSSAAFYSFSEIILSETRYAIPWMNMAVTQVYSYPVIQIASIFGGVSVSLLIMFTSSLLADALNNIRSIEARRAAGAAAAFAFSLNVICGFASAVVVSSERGEQIRTAAVGGGISMEEKNSAVIEDFGRIYTASATDAAEAGAELLVLPETSFPYDIARYPAADKIISEIAENESVTLIAGAYTRAAPTKKQNHDSADDSSGASEDGLCNSLVMYSPDGERGGEYVKRHLVPLSEFIAGGVIGDMCDHAASLLSPFGLTAQRLTAGSDGVITSDTANVGGIICFDSLFWDSAVDSVRDGADLLAVSANDAVLGDNFSERIHLSHAVVRAVETGRYAVRASTGGISAVIGPEGRLRAASSGGVAVATAERRDKLTPFCRIGPYVLPLSLLFICAAISFANPVRREICRIKRKASLKRFKDAKKCK